MSLQKAPPKKLKHPYASIEHRVLDSPAYADLSFSAQALLLIIARQLNGRNNGQLQATFSYCNRYGFGSEHTLRNALSELLTHGFIYRTRSHGTNGAWAKYAVTWQSMGKDCLGLFLDGFVHEAWKRWQPDTASSEKKPQQKVQGCSGRKCSFTHQFPAENAGNHPAKNADYELIPCTRSEARQGAGNANGLANSYANRQEAA